MLWWALGCCPVACVIEYLVLARLSAQPVKQMRVVAKRTTMRISDLRMLESEYHMRS